MGYCPLVAWCLPLADLHYFCVTKVYICIDKTVPGLLDVTRFLSLDVTICYDVIQVRMDQGLVVKIRCPMRSW